MGAASTAVGVVPLFISPLGVIADAATLRAEMAAVGANPADMCRLLADGERRLANDSDEQAAGQRWYWHAGNVAFNVGVGLLLGLGFGHWAAGGINAAAGIGIGELIILTQPTSSVADWRDYRAGRLDGEAQPLGLGARYRGRF